jgi:Fe(II)/alpha-ketoglutarate-dependent arginine beta-hydroxylase
MNRLTLTPTEIASIAPMLDELVGTYDTVESPDLVGRSVVLAGGLPPRLREFLEDHRLREPSAVCMVSGFPVDEELLGPTPEHWRGSHLRSTSLRQEIFFLLCGSLLGDVFGWSTQQDGRIMHDVLPIKGHEYEEIGSNSLQHLSWHTEDAFHPCRGDYVALMCLRNPDAVETTVGDAGDLDWTALDVEALRAAEYTQMPDNSHRPENATESTGDPTLDRLRARSLALIQSWNDDPVKRPVVLGDPAHPYLALDPYHMRRDGWSRRATEAFDGLCAQIEAHLVGIALRPGDCAFIDNFRAVHGRSSFRARYDGRDRWLKRLNITRNLRTSRAWRASNDGRIVY